MSRLFREIKAPKEIVSFLKKTGNYKDWIK